MDYILRHFDTQLLGFSATESSDTPTITIRWVAEENTSLLPLDLDLSPEGLSRWLKRRSIPRNRAYVTNLLSKCGLSINRKLGLQFTEALNDLFVLDALICNTDRHLGNFGFLVNNYRNEIEKPAPLFDHGNSLFSLAGQDDLVSDATLTTYTSTLLPRLYDDFIGTAKRVLEPRHREGLRRLLDFRLKRHPRYNLPPKRLKLVEKQIQRRARILLGKE